LKVLSVVGARPNFMKVAPLHAEMTGSGIDSRIVHTGQHYDRQMSEVFFNQLELPEPDAYLGVGSGSHAAQTARIMEAFDEALPTFDPDGVVVVGDVNSTLACTLVAVKRGIPVAHVEAGLRSGDRTMPEEINRIVTDSISDLLFVSEPSGVRNLRQEGHPSDRIHLVGNVMIDMLVHLRERAAALETHAKLGLEAGSYALTTVHRPVNVDHVGSAMKVSRILLDIAERMPLVFPIHPRTRGRFEEFGLMDTLLAHPSLKVLQPQGYLEFLGLMDHAKIVLTDSGGIQEETTYLGIPCLTIRDSTERPITIEMGTNRLLPLEEEAVRTALNEILDDPDAAAGLVPDLWDGRTASRIVPLLDRAWGQARTELARRS